jgi:hypothetical protein
MPSVDGSWPKNRWKSPPSPTTKVQVSGGAVTPKPADFYRTSTGAATCAVRVWFLCGPRAPSGRPSRAPTSWPGGARTPLPWVKAAFSQRRVVTILPPKRPPRIPGRSVSASSDDVANPSLDVAATASMSGREISSRQPILAARIQIKAHGQESVDKRLPAPSGLIQPKEVHPA